MPTVNINITSLYLDLISKLENHIEKYGISNQLNNNLLSFKKEINSTSLHNIKYTVKEITNKKDYLDNLNLIKSIIWAKGIQLIPKQKESITYFKFRELCVFLNSEIKALSSEPVNTKTYSGKMINHLDHLTSNETYSLIEESEDKKVFLGHKWKHRVIYSKDPELGWIEINFCSFMEHPINF